MPDLTPAEADRCPHCGKLRGIIRRFWEWQRTLPDLLPEGLADDVRAALGDYFCEADFDIGGEG